MHDLGKQRQWEAGQQQKKKDLATEKLKRHFQQLK